MADRAAHVTGSDGDEGAAGERGAEPRGDRRRVVRGQHGRERRQHRVGACQPRRQAVPVVQRLVADAPADAIEPAEVADVAENLESPLAMAFEECRQFGLDVLPIRRDVWRHDSDERGTACQQALAAVPAGGVGDADLLDPDGVGDDERRASRQHLGPSGDGTGGSEHAVAHGHHGQPVARHVVVAVEPRLARVVQDRRAARAGLRDRVAQRSRRLEILEDHERRGGEVADGPRW
ncbi:MAG: hypothetical protein WKF58_10950 [Ilumatobacteraceae bacterium]